MDDKNSTRNDSLVGRRLVINDVIFECHAAVMLIIDPGTGSIVYANPAAARFYGWSQKELQGMKIQEINTLPDEEVFIEMDKVRAQKRERFEFKHRHADGSISDVEVLSSTFEIDGTTLLHSIIYDVTDRKHTEEFLRMLKATIDVAADAAYWMDVEGRIVYVNISGCTALGYSNEELLDLTIFDVNPTVTLERWSQLWQVLRTRKKITSETIHRRKDGTEFPVEIASTYFMFGEMEYVNGFARNITIRKHTEEALLRAQRLESLGGLAGGIAHDFNNLLGGIFGNIDMAADVTKEKNVADYLAKALSSIDRARALTRQLLTFAKGGAPIKKLEHLAPFIEETTRFALSGSNISVRFVMPDGLWACEFDRNQIGQVIDNIVINALQAMPEGGIIEVIAENVLLAASSQVTLPAGNYVTISIKDSGIGMPREILPKIFDPFFTTKTKGQGLGLATCYSIVNRHGGCIDVESEPGKGSMFSIFLPASLETTVSAIPAITGIHQGSGSILVMDDEPVIQDAVSSMLTVMGYTVYCVSNSREALALFEQRSKEGDSFSAVILDLTIPGEPGGKETIGEIRKRHKTVPVFVASGYADDPVMANPRAYGFNDSICKPFRKAELAKLLHNHII